MNNKLDQLLQQQKAAKAPNNPTTNSDAPKDPRIAMWTHMSESTQVGLSDITRAQLSALWDKYDANNNGLEPEEIKLMVKEFAMAQQQLVNEAKKNSSKAGGYKYQLDGHPMADLLVQIVDAELAHKSALLEIKIKYVEATEADVLLKAMNLDKGILGTLVDKALFVDGGQDVLFAERKALACLALR
jgi:hypothetical protein